MTKEKIWQEPLDESDPEIAAIAALRREVSDLMMINNALVAQVWEIDRQCQDTHFDDALRKSLLIEYEVIQKKIAEEGYGDKIKALKQNIYELEVAKFGQSGVLDNSPNASNSFL